MPDLHFKLFPIKNALCPERTDIFEKRMMRSKTIIAFTVLLTIGPWALKLAFCQFLYGTRYLGLYKIGPTDGSETQIHSGTFWDTYTGLAYVPEPATLLLLDFGWPDIKNIKIQKVNIKTMS